MRSAVVVALFIILCLISLVLLYSRSSTSDPPTDEGDDGETAISTALSADFSTSTCVDLSLQEGFRDHSFDSRISPSVRIDPNLTEIWEVKHCPQDMRTEKTDCGMFFVRRKVDCPNIKPSWLSQMRAMRYYLEFGPDEFRLILEGPEAIAPLPSADPEQPCTYRFSYCVAIPGTYRVQLFHTRENWTAANEVKKEYASIHYDSLLGGDTFVQLGNTLETERRHSETLEHSAQLPPCLSNHSSGGRFVARKGKLETNPIAAEAHRGYCHGFGVSKFVLNLSDSESVEWLPYKCRYGSVDSELIRQCGKNKQIGFFGDSHAFWMFNVAILSFVSPEALERLPRGANSPGFQHQDKGCVSGKEFPVLGDLVFCYIRGGMGEYILREENLAQLKEYDVIVANFGHWPASYRGTWNASVYADRMHLMIENLRQTIGVDLAENRRQFIWFLNVASALPPTGTAEEWEKRKETRTAQRMIVFNRVAEEVLQREYERDSRTFKYYLLDAMLPTWIGLEHSKPRDCAHFYSIPIMKAMQQMLWTTICENK